MNNQKPPNQPPKPAVPANRPTPSPVTNVPAKEIDKPANSLLLTKTKPIAKVNGEHPFNNLLRSSRHHYISGLFFGQSGTGKTSILGSAGFDPRTGPILILGFDDSLQSLRGIPEDVVKPVVVETWDDIALAWDYLRTEKHPYKSVGLDGLTDLHIYSLLTLVEQKVENSDRRDDVTTTELADFGNSMAQIRRIITLFKRLPMHLFFTAQPKTASVPRVGNQEVPSLFGQMSKEVAGAFDICAYTSNAPVHLQAGTPEYTKYQNGPKNTRFVYLQNTPQLLVKVRNEWAEKKPTSFVEIDQERGMTTILDALGL